MVQNKITRYFNGLTYVTFTLQCMGTIIGDFNPQVMSDGAA